MADSLTLRGQYTECAQAMRDLVEASEKEDREFTPEEKSRFNEYRANLEKLESRIEAVEAIEKGIHVYEDDAQREEDERIAWERKKQDIAPQESTELTYAEQADGLRAWLLGPGNTTPDQQALATRAGFNVFSRNIEIKPTKTAEERAQGVATGGAGGFTVADEMMAALTKQLALFGGVRRACRVVNTTTGADFPWPVVNDTAATSDNPLAENTADDEQDVTFTQVVLQAYKVTSDIVRVSAELMQDASFNMTSVLGELLGERVGRFENALLTTGTGTSQHDGIVTAAGDSGVTSASNSAYTWSEILQLVHSVDPAYRLNASFMCNDTTLRILREIDDSQNRPLWNADLSAGAPGTFAGHPIVINQSMASGTTAKALLFGDMSQYVVRSVDGITLRRSDQRYFEFHQDAFVAFIRSDGDILVQAAIKYLTNAV